MKNDAFAMLKPVGRLALPLLKWYDGVAAARDMPWRLSRDPYAIWLSETMLQQTQVETVKPYYRRFLGRFPTIEALAAAPLQDVLALWAGLGYYRRAKHLHQAAQAVVERYDGKLPADVEALLGLPGIGRYTAGAVGSIAFGLPVAVVDGNVMRVLSRLTGYDRDIGVPKNHVFFWEVAEEVVRGAGKVDGRYGDVNQGLMELGATVCVPGVPRCEECPVRTFCRALKEGRQAELPVKGKKGKVPEVRGVAVVVMREKTAGKGKRREVLMMRRGAGGLWEGMWEFPVLADGMGVAEIEEAIGLTVGDMNKCGDVEHQLTHRLMRYEVVVCRAKGDGGRVRVMDGYVEARWVSWPVKGLPMARVVGKIAEKIA